ncbi:MAG: hypothetical protein AB1400_11070 [Pseudomonadota bacterium]
MKFGSIFLASLLFAPTLAQATYESNVSRIYFFNPDPTDISNSMDALEAAMKTRSYNPAKQVGLLPTDLPEKLGEPQNKAINFGPAAVNMLSCGTDAYVQYSTNSTTNAGIIGNTNDRFFGCMYVSKKGIRLAVVFEQSSSTNGSLMGMMMGGIKKVARGNDNEYAKKSFDEIIAKVREKAPNILIELREVPGDVTRPDDEKVKTALAAYDKKTAESKSGTTPTSEHLVSAPAVTTSPQTNPALEARKQLTSLGLTYYSLDQFHDAVRRKDAIVVDLFLQAKSVSPKTTNKKGESALDIARKTGDSEILGILNQQANQVN